MDLKEIQEILKFINKSDLTDVEIEQKDFRLRVQRRAPEQVVYAGYAAAPAMQMAPAVQQVAQPAALPQVQAPKAEGGSDASSDNAKLHTFRSPMIGTFYRSPSPDKEPFSKVGDTISAGSIVCIIEAMKLFNEIECDVTGKIVKILVDNAQPVEYDQPLFLIELA